MKNYHFYWFLVDFSCFWGQKIAKIQFLTLFRKFTNIFTNFEFFFKKKKTRTNRTWGFSFFFPDFSGKKIWKNFTKKKLIFFTKWNPALGEPRRWLRGAAGGTVGRPARPFYSFPTAVSPLSLTLGSRNRRLTLGSRNRRLTLGSRNLIPDFIS